MSADELFRDAIEGLVPVAGSRRDVATQARQTSGTDHLTLEELANLDLVVATFPETEVGQFEPFVQDATTASESQLADGQQDITELFELHQPKEMKPQEIVDAFDEIDEGDLPAVFELFKTMPPPKKRTDRNLIDQQLRPILQAKGIKDAKAVIRDWFRVADEDGTLDAAAGVIPPTAELPADERVDGHELLDDLISFYERYVHARPDDFLTAALWNLMTHGCDLFDILPFLCIGAPDKSCGKSTFLGLFFETAESPMPSSSITGPGVFRAVDALHPCLLIDEGDKAIETNDDLRAILSASHMRRHAIVMRLVGEKYEPKFFSTWAPKAFTAIGPIKDDQIASRAIRIELEKKPSSVTKASARQRNILVAGEGLRAKCAKWMRDNALRIRSLDLSVVEGLSDRVADNWEPMLVIAKVIGEDVYQAALVAARCHVDDTESLGERLLAHIRDAFREAGDPDRLSTTKLLAYLVTRDDGPWPKWWEKDVEAGKINGPASRLASLLTPYKLRSHKIKVDGTSLQGYRRSDLEPAWRSYVRAPEGTDAPDARNPGTVEVDAGFQSELPIEPVPTSHGPDQQGSVVPTLSDDAPSTCANCGAEDRHWHWCEEEP